MDGGALAAEVTDEDLLDAIGEITNALIKHIAEGTDATADPRLKGWLPANRSQARWRACAQNWVLLDHVDRMLREGRRCALRDLHYQLKQTELFPGGAPDVSAAIVRLLELLGKWLGRSPLSRSALRIVSAPKGFVAGPLVLTTEQGVHIDTSLTPFSIPGDLAEIAQFSVASTSARFVLVVEKHTVFQQLVDAGFHATYRAIIITGRGFPDMGTRAFLRAITDQLGLAPFALTDFNPSGVHIFLSFKEGASAQARAEGDVVLTPSLRWLGLHSADVSPLPRESLDDLTERDRGMIRTMLGRTSAAGAAPLEPLVQHELRAMQQAGVKADLDHIGRAALFRRAPDRVGDGSPADKVDLAALIASKLARHGT
ncbi:hypothetical protein KFE25_006370 [Diacronema lutheri]|uniref:Topoisomerase 6 subunit A/Spo11 TOPRIM domain-containing protein n=1 Tax=Diacronema lutheri TaxID=2081491 RepID=A0A8J5Y1Z7_DIALT|nr:hypothetical protein KFE25_006370 [Diacronema lutheri]